MPRRTAPADAEARVPLQCKAPEGVRDQLQRAAVQSGRSLAQELEARLVQSLSSKDIAERTGEITLQYIQDRDQLLQMILGSKETLSFLIDIAYLVQGIEDGQKEQWHESSALRAQLYKTLEAALPEIIRAPRGEEERSAFSRAVNYARFLPDRPRVEPSVMPDGLRFMTDDELKKAFHRNDDNA